MKDFRHDHSHRAEPPAEPQKQNQLIPGKLALTCLSSTLLRKSDSGAGSTVDADAQVVLDEAGRRTGSPLPEPLRSELESALGRDLSRVRIHTDSMAAAAARAISAKAFARGEDIFFAPGQYNPRSKHGRELIAHEVAHTVQSIGGVSTGSLQLSSPGDHVERDADAFAAAFTAGLPRAAPGANIVPTGETRIARVTEEQRQMAEADREWIEARIESVSRSVTSRALDDIIAALRDGKQRGPNDEGLISLEIDGQVCHLLPSHMRPMISSAEARQRSREEQDSGQGEAEGQSASGGDNEQAAAGGDRGGSNQGASEESSGQSEPQSESESESESEDEEAEAEAQNDAEVTHQNLTGSWESSDSNHATLQLNQAGTYFTGRYQIRQRDPDDTTSLNPDQMGRMRLNRGRLTGDVTSDGMDATEYRFEGEPTGGRHGAPFSGTLRLRRDGKLILTHGDGGVYRFGRSSHGGALSDEMIEGLDESGQEDELQPLSQEQRQRISQASQRISAECREHGNGFFGTVNPVTSADSARAIEAEIEALSDEFPEVQHAQVRQDLRQLLFRGQVRENMSCLEMTRSICWQHEDQTPHARAFLALEQPSAADQGTPPYYYRMQFVLLGAEAEVGIGVGFHAGRVKFQEGRLPNEEEDPGSTNWSVLAAEQFSMVRGTFGMGASAGINFGEWSDWKFSEPTNDHWRMEDIPGRFYSGGGSLGGRAGRGVEPEGGVLFVVGSAGYRPLEFRDWGLNSDVLLGAEAGVGVQVQTGTIASDEGLVGQSADGAARENDEGEANREVTVAVGQQDFVGFDTDVDQLSGEARARLRQFCAQNLELLRNPETRVEIHGYASRRGSDEHNLHLSQRRANNTYRAMSAIVGYSETSWPVVGHGEDDARLAGLEENDNSDAWRRVDVVVNGEVAVRIRASRERSREEEGESRVQRQSDGAARTRSPAEAASTARAGVGGAVTALPHRERIQRSFGAHDVGSISAHTDLAARSASKSLGARAYASGESIAFASTPDLFTAAHEAAHVVQQRQGNVGRGLGPERDAFERHADAVAERVISGGSAESLLGSPGRSKARPSRPMLERELHASGPLRGLPVSWETDAGGLAAEDRELLREWLIGRGIVASEVGDLTSCGSLLDGGDRLTPACRRLVAIAAGGGRRGDQNRVIRGWNRHLDDLGNPNNSQRSHPREAYPTILHFLDAIDQHTQATMGQGYEEAIDDMPAVDLAGSTVVVNPRNVYFVAAAQAGMDEAAGITDPGRHYIAPGAFWARIRQANRTLARLIRHPHNADWQQVVEELSSMREELEHQREEREGGATGQEGHNEASLADWMHGAPGAAIAAADAGLTSREQIRDAARRLREGLNPLPSGAERNHGSAAVDPHGTDHAIGNAIDINNGAGEAASTNVRFPRDFAPFLWELMDRHPPYGLVGLRPTAISHLDHSQRQALSALLENHGQAERSRIERRRREVERGEEREQEQGREEDPDAASTSRAERRHEQEFRSLLAHSRTISRELYRRFREIRGELPQLMRDRTPELTSLDNAEQLLRELETGRDTLQPRYIRDQLVRVRDFLDEFSTTTFQTAFHAHDIDSERVGELMNQISPGRRIQRRSLRETIDQMEPHLRAANTRTRSRRTDDLERIVVRRDFQRWLDRVSSGRAPLYDQPDELIAGIQSVRGHRDHGGRSHSGMHGSHHWQVTDRNVVTSSSTGPYASALRRDMTTRNAEQMTRILSIMARSQGGQQVLASDETFAHELDRWATAQGGRSGEDFRNSARQQPIDE